MSKLLAIFFVLFLGVSCSHKSHADRHDGHQKCEHCQKAEGEKGNCPHCAKADGKMHKCENCKKGKKMMTAEQHAQMAKLHNDVAACLKAKKTEEECHKLMHTEMSKMDFAHGCKDGACQLKGRDKAKKGKKAK